MTMTKPLNECLFSCLFVLQLACILSMSSRWKSTVLRVFICVNSLQVSQESTTLSEVSKGPD